MKNRHGFPAFLLSALLILALGPGGTLAEATAPPPDDMAQSFRAVLLGDSAYTQVNHYDSTVEEAAFAGEISSWYGYGFESPLTYEAFCVTDLDKDGSPEIILRLSRDFGYEALRYWDGRVYGYPFVARAMEALTKEGAIHGSSGADDYGWYRVSFLAEQMETIELC